MQGADDEVYEGVSPDDDTNSRESQPGYTQERERERELMMKILGHSMGHKNPTPPVSASPLRKAPFRPSCRYSGLE